MNRSPLTLTLSLLSVVLIVASIGLTYVPARDTTDSNASTTAASEEFSQADSDDGFCMQLTAEAAILFTSSDRQCEDYDSVSLVVTEQLDDGTLILTGYGI